MKKYIYVSGADNTEFWEKLKYLKNHAEEIGFRWAGPYAVHLYQTEALHIWEYWKDVDNGIPSELKQIS